MTTPHPHNTPTTIILVRHGESTWHGLWKGQGDPPLSDHGRQQARTVAQRLSTKSIDALYASDLQRSFQTAQIIGEALGLEPQPDARLRELDVGTWSGLTIEEIERDYPEQLQAWREYKAVRPGGGELFEEMQARVAAWLEETVANNHAGETVCAVTHGGVVYALRGHVLGIRRGAELFGPLPPNRNTAVTIIRHRDGRGEIELLMDASHLDQA